MPDNRPQDGRTAADVMTAAPRTCSPFSTITEAALIFRDEDCGAVPVLEDGKPVGILTDRDIALAVTRYSDLHSRPVSDVMSKSVVTVAAEDRLESIAAKFTEAKVHRLLVIDAAGQLAGIIALSDLLAHLPEREIGHLLAGVDERPGTDGGATRIGEGPAKSASSGDKGPGARSPWAWASPGKFWGLLRATAHEWSEDKVPRLGAALAFYSVLSIAPLLLIAIAVAALVFGEEAARGQLIGQFRGMVGKEGAEAIQEMLKNAHKPDAGIGATLIGFVTLLFAASGVFGELQDAMNTIWEVQPKPGRGILGVLKDRFLSFSMVLGTGFLLLVSLVLSAAVEATFSILGGLAPGLKPLLQVGDLLVSALVVMTLFGLIFKVLPDAKIDWHDVWVGSALTTALFLVGKVLIGAYLGRSSFGSAYGAAGSLVVLLVWIYYSSQILYFGAEFTKVYANQYGSRIEPSAGAERVTADARAQQGIPRSGARA